MVDRKHPDVLVAGAGPVGLFASLVLARRGVRVQVIDKGVWPCTHSYALALHPASIRLFEELGLHQRILEGAVAVRGIGLYDAAGRKALVRMDEAAGFAYPVAVMRQDVLEELLEKALAEAGVKVEWNHDLFSIQASPGSVLATVNQTENESRGYAVAHVERVVVRTTELEVPFLIGADGYNSRVRRALRAEFPEVGPAQHYAVFEFRSNADLGQEMRLVLGENTTDALWPLPGGACRWSFELPDFAAAGIERVKDRQLMPGWGSFPELGEENLKALIRERAPWFEGSIDQITWRIVVRFERRLATAFGEGRLWLAGDSAHLTGPAGIQSMNLGLEEAHHLATCIADIVHNGASLETLNDYGRRWMAEWRKLHGLEGELQAGPSTDRWVARHAKRLRACLPAHGDAFQALVAQLGLS